MPLEQILQNANEQNVVAGWHDAHLYSAAPRHRRRIVLDVLAHLEFKDVLDAGCAQGFLLEQITRRFDVAGYGCDISDKVIEENQHRLRGIQFRALDLTRQRWPGDKQFDVVISSEVIEHIPQWQGVVASLAAMSRKHLLITVPTGKIRAMDRLVGHHQHFQGPELRATLEANGFVVDRIWKWGFPMHSLYKRLLSMLPADHLYEQFADKPYGAFEKIVSRVLDAAFYLNVFPAGAQLYVLAHRAPQQTSH